MNRPNVAVVIALGLAVLSGSAAAQTTCNRSCLGNALAAYLGALTANDPAAAPLGAGFRQTENAVVVREGTGLWATATGLGAVDRRYFDAEAGQAAWFGVLDEGETAAVALLRLRVEAREITEAEWYVGREGGPGINGPVGPGEPGGNLYDLDNLVANPPPERIVPPAERLSRRALIGITNSYFDGITTHDGAIIRAHRGCLRVENGLETTGRPLDPGSTDGLEGRTDCMSNMGSFGIANVAGRRYPLVDVEAQVVLGTVVFIRNPGSAQRRNGLSELFYIDGGRIRSIYAAMFYPAPDVPVPNWPPYDGNFPLPAGIGPD